MKKLFIFLCAGLMMTACIGKKNQSQEAGESGQLQGLYEVDLNSLLEDEDEDMDAFSKAIASAVLSQLKLTFEFKEDKLTIDASGMARGLLDFIEESGEMPVTVDYRLEQDSILFTHQDDGEWREAGVLRALPDSKEDLLWVVDDETKFALHKK